jgi:hypothetical protein
MLLLSTRRLRERKEGEDIQQGKIDVRNWHPQKQRKMDSKQAGF